jgi:predicted 3-demethylubiquinone-9 3-methyltransferase (glyoxalase superfamily)
VPAPTGRRIKKEDNMSVITPNPWFDTEALDAAAYYVGITPGSRINDVSYYGDSKVLTVRAAG